MTEIIIDYQPFSRSQVFTIINGEKHVTSTPSDLPTLAKSLLTCASWINNNYELDNIKISVRAAEIFYDELSRIVQTQLQNYSNLPITMERIEE